MYIAYNTNELFNLINLFIYQTLKESFNEVINIFIRSYFAFRGGASYGGVGAAIARSGGEAGLKAYDSYMETKGELEFGRALVTPSGGGNAQSLIHVVSVGSGESVEFETVRDSIKNALVEAQNNGIKTIAAPALGTGIIGQLTDAQSAKAMLAGVAEFVAQGGTGVEEFRIVVFGPDKAAKPFKKVAKTGAFEGAVVETGAREANLGRWAVEMHRPGRTSEPRSEMEMERNAGEVTNKKPGFLKSLSSAAGNRLNLGSKGDGTKVDPKAAAKRGSKTK